MSTQNSLSLIESLPQELLAEILARVASSSVEDISHCLTVSRTISSAVQDDHVIKRLNLRPQAMNPMLTFHRYQHLMVKAINSDNPAAHYTEGIKQFFTYDNRTIGLLHLKKSAGGSYDNGAYLYGILMSCMGNIEEGGTPTTVPHTNGGNLLQVINLSGGGIIGVFWFGVGRNCGRKKRARQETTTSIPRLRLSMDCSSKAK
ncbi:hypothetical protein F2Q70_00039153 [Brassica cretica]|uniref:At2g35280-like TPR domain-containing protein n=1 Tax=Brassica cretica TaxID=69181 RepID=A0A8S9K3W2_BRACR|nr:hypothetical protein F2Q70_00039153 [Brassica cretica]